MTEYKRTQRSLKEVKGSKRTGCCKVNLPASLLYTLRVSGQYDDLRQEFRGFPDGKHDDQVDSITQFVVWTYGNRGKALFNRNPETGRRIVRRKPGRRRA